MLGTCIDGILSDGGGTLAYRITRLLALEKSSSGFRKLEVALQTSLQSAELDRGAHLAIARACMRTYANDIGLASAAGSC